MLIYFYPTKMYADGLIHLHEERWQLGDLSFKNFWVKDGYKIFTNIVQTSPDLLDDMTIKDEDGETYNATELLDILAKYKMINEE